MNEVHIRTLHRAVQIKGTVAALASHLGVPEQSLLLWLDAKASVPPDVFVRAVDLLLAAELSGTGVQREAMRPRVLVVDDDLGGAYSLARLIKQLGYPVETATSGTAALEIARRMRPEVIFLDLRMPDINGLDVAAQLKAEGLQSRIIAATVYGSAQDRLQTSQAGFAAHLVKPIEARSLQGLLPPRNATPQ